MFVGVPTVTAHACTIFAGIPTLTCEPIRRGPAACLRYMQNQSTGRYTCYQDEDVLSWFSHASATFERRMSGDLTAPWATLIRQCLREAAPWYVRMQVVPVQSVAHRRAYRVLSRGTGLSKRRHWGVAVDTIQAHLLPGAMARAAERFGGTSCRLYDGQKMARWSGQPVLLCYRVVASRSTASRLPVSGPWPPDSTASRRGN
jgi:hypothetical protein